MREALAALTLRGRSFLAGGMAAVACAVLLGQQGLVRVGVLALLLPLFSAAFLARSRYRLALQREVSPRLVAAGQPATVTLTLTNEGRTPTGILLLEDRVPYLLGSQPRFVLEGISHGWRRQVTYRLRSEVRGHYEVGPMTVRVTDPFGLVELGRSFHTTAPLTVTPRTTELPPVPLGGAWTGSGDNRPRSFATGSAEDVTVREYRRGDDLRRVHWRSSARVGELMVRREEQPWQSRAIVVLDNRRVAHRGEGPASSLEAAVSAAASVAVHLAQRGYLVRLITASGDDPSHTWHARDPKANIGPLLERLAVVDFDSRHTMDTAWLAEPGQGLTVAVLGAGSPADRQFLTRVQHQAGTPLAIVLDVDAWAAGRDIARGTDAAHPTAMLAATGWRAVSLGPGDRLDSAWQELGRTGSRAAQQATTATGS
ncbi:DUF58 domain-containing protein [Nocardioides campestrisoli]|uniref:DUF58 domain-containing protein n=1 Tax=Nocardioides campestrisoli TaxID=2736757 RepID=UPI00163DE561|nr:DUF58 domain-containing protein [Nocardioides campestrisoli]